MINDGVHGAYEWTHIWHTNVNYWEDNLLQTPKTLVLSGIFSTSRVNFQAEHSSELNFFWEHQSQRKTQFNKAQNVMTNENVAVSKYKS